MALLTERGEIGQHLCSNTIRALGTIAPTRGAFSLKWKLSAYVFSHTHIKHQNPSWPTKACSHHAHSNNKLLANNCKYIIESMCLYVLDCPNASSRYFHNTQFQCTPLPPQDVSRFIQIIIIKCFKLSLSSCNCCYVLRKLRLGVFGVVVVKNLDLFARTSHISKLLTN